jgi:hypothetical protein
MLIDPAVLSSITAVVSQLALKAAEGAAPEAGKDTWAGIKSIFGWSSDPELKEIPAKVADAVAVSPELLDRLLQLLKKSQDGTNAALVGKIDARDSNVIVTNSLGSLNIR